MSPAQIENKNRDPLQQAETRTALNSNELRTAREPGDKPAHTVLRALMVSTLATAAGGWCLGVARWSVGTVARRRHARADGAPSCVSTLAHPAGNSASSSSNVATRRTLPLLTIEGVW